MFVCNETKSTPVTIGGEAYTVRLDVAVKKTPGSAKPQNVIRGIEVTKATEQIGEPNTTIDRISAEEELEKAYFEQISQLMNAETAGNNTPSLDNSTGEGYNGSGKMDVTDGIGDYGKVAENGNNNFSYKNNPMDNPKAAKDIFENSNAIYGYSPNPKSERIGKYADYDWANPKLVALAKVRRDFYHSRNANIRSLVDSMKIKGFSVEETARAVNNLRNLNRLNDYINDPVGLEKVKQSNLKVYGNENGLTAENAYKKYGSWEKVIEHSLNSNPGMDACCGLYDKYYSGGNEK